MAMHHLEPPVRLYSHGDREDRYIAICFCGYRSRPQRTGALAERAGQRHIRDTATAAGTRR